MRHSIHRSVDNIARAQTQVDRLKEADAQVWAEIRSVDVIVTGTPARPHIIVRCVLCTKHVKTD